MGFKEVQDLDCETTTALGGRNKTTGKANPTKVEGYYIGSKDVDSPKSKTGACKLYVIQTANGNLGIWGKTDLDRKMGSVPQGAMIRITQTGMQKIPGKNDMYKFKVEVDAENTIEVSTSLTQGQAEDAGNDYAADEETDLDDDTQLFDEAPPVRASRPAQAATVPDAARQKRVQDLLKGRGKVA